MGLKNYVKEDIENILRKCVPVDPKIIEQYNKEVEKNYPKYLVEERKRRIKVAKLSHTTII